MVESLCRLHDVLDCFGVSDLCKTGRLDEVNKAQTERHFPSDWCPVSVVNRVHPIYGVGAVIMRVRRAAAAARAWARVRLWGP